MYIPRLGYFADANPKFPERLGDVDYFIDHLVAAGHRDVKLLDDYTGAVTRKIVERIPDIRVVLRFSGPGEKTDWKHLDNIEGGVRSLKDRGDPPNVVYQILNEPELSNVRQLCDWGDRHMDAMASASLKGDYFGFDMDYSRQQVMAGEFDQLHTAAHRHRGWHRLSFDEYAAVSTPNSINHPPEWLLDPRYQRVYGRKDADGVWRGDWPRSTDFTLQAGVYQHRVTVRRVDWHQVRCLERGIAPLDIDFGEVGWDHITDRNLDAAYKSLEQFPGYPAEFPQRIKGVLTYPKIWKWYWDNWTHEEAAAEQLLYLFAYNGIYPEWVKVGFLYIWRSDDPEWSSDDFGKWYVFHRQIEPSTPPPPKPVPQPIPEPIPPQETPTMVDVLQYIKGDGRCYRLGPEICYTLALPDGDWLAVKNHNWEHLGATPSAILRGADCSPEPNKMYIPFTVYPGGYGAFWCKRDLKLGEVVKRSNYEVWYLSYQQQEDASKKPPSGLWPIVTSWLRLDAIRGDEIDLGWYLSEFDLAMNKWEEMHTYRRLYGLVNFKNRAGLHYAFGGDLSEGMKLAPDSQVWIYQKWTRLSSSVQTPAPAPTPPPTGEIRTIRNLPTPPLTDAEFEIVKKMVNGLK